MAPPLDPRLLRHASAARGHVAVSAGLGVLTAGLVVAQVLLLADVVAGVAQGSPARRWSVVALAVVLGVRAVVVFGQERWAHRAATRVVGQLRAAVVARAARLGRSADGPAGAVGTADVATRGLSALEPYLDSYLPQLLVAAVVPPALLVVVLAHDLVAFATISLTLPLVPLFMALVGLTTRDASRRRLVQLQALGAQVLDLVAGLATLRALGRARAQAVRVREAGDAARAATAATLRMAFLSSFVLEVLTTLSVALVAVGVGLRLVSGSIDLHTGLVVLLLAPEVYLPLRAVGASFHASADGAAAAQAAFAVLDSPLPASSAAGHDARPDTASTSWGRLCGVGVAHPGRAGQSPHGLSLRLTPGRLTALVGPSGCGKSTAVAVLLGLRPPTSGTAHPVPHDRVAWVPQRPLLVPGTLAENARLTTPDADLPALDAAAARVGLTGLVAQRGWGAQVGGAGHGLSAGQRQRLALLRALLRVQDAARPADVVVLDEPTAHLDAATEAVVLRLVRELADAGCAVLVVAHRPELVGIADEVVTVGAAAPGLVDA